MSDHNKPGFIFKGDANFATMSMPPSGLTRIADALERIAKELERQNKLKAATLRATIENDYLDEIMED